MSDDDCFYTDSNGVSWRTVREWLWCEVLGACGCGSSDELADLCWRVFDESSDFGKPGIYTFDNPLAAEVIAHWMDHAGLTEHGGSVFASWLSEKGKAIHGHILAVDATWEWFCGMFEGEDDE